MNNISRYLKTIVCTLVLLLLVTTNLPLAYAANEADTAEPTASSELNTEEETKLEAFKEELLVLINLEREKVGVEPLEGLELLYDMANVRAEEASIRFRHTRPDGTRCFTIFKQNALTYKAAGENLAYGYSQPGDIVKAWMNSPSHKDNILDPDFQFVGIGYYDNGRRVYSSLLFYTPKSSSYQYA